MPQAADQFDPCPYLEREAEVLLILAQHVSALSDRQLSRLEGEGAVLVNLQALETSGDFGLDDLRIAFVQPGEAIHAVEARVGLDWVSSFAWLHLEAERKWHDVIPASNPCYREVLSRVLAFNWYELVLWEIEERWLDQS